MTKILAIDDKKDNLITIAAIVKSMMEDCTVIPAESGPEGIALAETMEPDTIILDVKMPEMDGFEVCRRLKMNEKTAHIPLILLTAIRTDTKSRIQGLEIGADAFLTKPIDESELIAQINVMLRIKRAEDMLRKEKDLLEITVQERTEDLRKERDFIKSLDDASPAYYVAINSGGNVAAMNKAMLTALGYSFSEVNGINYISTFVPEADRELVFRTFNRHVNNEPASIIENAVLTKEGEELIVEWQGRPFNRKDGSLEYVFFVGIDITERKRLEKIIMSDNEKERNRIGQNLHDGLGQHLAGIAFKSEILKLKILEESPQLGDDIREVVTLVSQAMNQTRELAKGLCPVDMASGGLYSALDELRISTEKMFDVHCMLIWDEGTHIEGDLEATHMYYIVKEAVNNAIRHGNARNILIAIKMETDTIRMSITDDGSGLPDDYEGRGMGLSIMHYRAWLIGASFTAGRNHGGGTIVSCVLRRADDRSAPGPDTGSLKDLLTRNLNQDTGAGILVVDDHPVVRQGLVQIINREKDLVVCGEAKNADEALQKMPRLNPSIVTVDISLKGSSGLELIKALKSRYPGLPVLVLSIYDESIYAERAIRAGARGYVMKQEAPNTVVRAIRTVLEGKVYLSDRVRETLLNESPFDGLKNIESPEECLTNREFEVFQLIGNGMSNRHISEKLKISVKTVENFRERIKNKLKIESSPDLVRYSVQWVINHAGKEH